MRIQVNFQLIAALSVLIPWFSTQPAVGHYLAKSRNANTILFMALGLALGGFIFGLFGFTDVKTSIAFVIPAFQLCIVRLGYYLFVKIMDRYPENVIFNWEDGLGLDRFFMIIMVLLGCVLPLAIVRSI